MSYVVNNSLRSESNLTLQSCKLGAGYSQGYRSGDWQGSCTMYALRWNTKGHELGIESVHSAFEKLVKWNHLGGMEKIKYKRDRQMEDRRERMKEDI